MLGIVTYWYSSCIYLFVCFKRRIRRNKKKFPISRMLDKAVHEGRLSGFSVGDSAGRSLVVPHLLFTDDTLIFCDANIDQMLILRMVLI